MKLFVAGLPLDVDNQELRELFEEFGTVTAAIIILDKETRQSRGFGFVDMPDSAAAKTAMAEMNISELDGHRFKVKPAEDKKLSTSKKH